MRTLLEKALVAAILSYMGKMRMQQNELAGKLGWSPSDLNDIIKGRKNIGKNRQFFLEEKLGAIFRQDLLLTISELSDIERRKPGRVADQPPGHMADKYILTDIERGYVDKLLAILRGINQQAKFAVKANIDTLYQCKKGKQDINEGYIRQLLEESKS